MTGLSGGSARGIEVIDLLAQALRMAGWAKSERREHGVLGDVLVARLDVDTGDHLRNITFARADTALTIAGDEHLHDDVVLFHDDANDKCPPEPALKHGGWLTPQSLAALAAGRAVEARELRLGRDLLFPFLAGSAIDTNPLTTHADAHSSRRENIAGIGLGDRLPKDDGSVRLCDGLLTSPSKSAIADYLPKAATLDDIFKAGMAGERALIAVHEADEANEFIASHLYDRHVRVLSKPGNVTDALPPTRLPLLLLAEDIWALGYQRTVREEVWRSTRISFTAEMIRGMMRLGYLHVYLPNVERLRLDTDLDPNTTFISDVLASAGEWGGFSLGCQRYHVFHFPTFEGYVRTEGDGEVRDSMLLRTMGERFARDKQLLLFDLGTPPRDRLKALSGTVEDRLQKLAAQVAEMCGARLGVEEARSLLLAISIRELEQNGSLIPKADLPTLIRRIVTGERRRPEHLTYIESAVLGSGALRQLDSGHISVASPLLAGALVAKHFGKRLRESVQTGKWDMMKPVLDIARLPYWIIRWGLTDAQLPAATLNTSIRDLLIYYGITRDHGPDEANQRENLVNLLLATIDVISDWTSRDGGARKPEDEPSYVLQQINTSGGVHAVGISMPQRVFYGLPLDNWSFRDCNLRGAVFANCDLGGITFYDCFLGGARFLQSKFSKHTRLERCDMSGALFDAAETLALLNLKRDGEQSFLDSLLLTSALIKGDDIDVIALRKKLVDGDCITLGLGVVNTARNVRVAGQKGAVEAFPDEYLEALGQHAWLDPAGAVLVKPRAGDGKPADTLLRSDKLVSNPYASGWPEGVKPRLVAAAQLGSAQLLLTIDEAGTCRYADLGLDQPEWTYFGTVIDARRISVETIEGEDRLLVAVAAASTDGYRPVHIFELRRGDRHGAVSAYAWGGLEREDLRQDVNGEVTALRWLERGTGDHQLLNLAIGFSSGTFMLFRHDQHWRRQSTADDIRSPVSAIGYSKFNNVLLVCHADGQAIGYRRTKAAVLQTLFKFHSAHRHVYDVVQLGQRGQMMIVGSQEHGVVGSTAARFQSAPMLCLLLNTAGAVLAVYPQSTAELKTSNGRYTIPSSIVGADLASYSDVERINRVIGDYAPKNASLVFRPGVDNSIEMVLQNVTSNVHLDPSIRDGASRRFREISLLIADPANNFTQRFNECDLKDVRADSASITIRASAAFPSETKRATATVAINYLDDSGRPDTDARRRWDFDIDVERDYNPFTSDGTPVSGEKFFGLEELIGTCTNLLIDRKIIIVNSRRRAGKTSFFQEMSRRIRRFGGGAVDRMSIIVSGENAQEGRGLVTEIARQIEEFEKINSEYSGLADALRRSSYEGSRDDSDIRRLALVAREVENRGLPLPIVVLIDEWGQISRMRISGNQLEEEANEAFVSGFMAQAEEVAKLGIAFCLTSVPNDFRIAASDAASSPYRYAVDPWLEINPMPPEILQALIKDPLKGPDYSITPEAIELVTRLSSGVPDDANRIMHHALRALRDELAADGVKRTKKEYRVIDIRHVEAASPETQLLSKYQVQLPSITSGLSQAEMDKLFSLAGNADQPADWDRVEPILIKRNKIPFSEKTLSFEEKLGQSGYRLLHDARQLQYRLWLPYGLTLVIRQRRDLDAKSA